MRIKYYYDLTENYGENLHASFNDKHFQHIIDDQCELYADDAVIGGDWREAFVDEYLMENLSIEEAEKIKKEYPNASDDIRGWLITHNCPSSVGDEDIMISEWADRRADDDAQDESLWDHFGHNDDIETALNFGLVKYPCTDESGKYIDGGGGNKIPADTANKIRELIDKANSDENLERSDAYREKADVLEKDAINKFITVSGFYCDIHGDNAHYEESLPKKDVLTCPSCGHPICPECANCYPKNPATVEVAREYMQSCDDVSGMAYCGQCGDWSEEFMKRFLKLVGCPIPPEYNTETKVRKARFCMTNTIAALPDVDSIIKEVKDKFDSGISGTIKVNHSSGEIWGYPERHPEGWVVTVLYPIER